MARRAITFVDLTRLQALGERASVIIRLMMAGNDIALANQCLGYYKAKESQVNNDIRHGAELYFVKMQCGHLNEAIKLIEEIDNDKYLLERVERCSKFAIDAFAKLKKCLRGGSDERKFAQYIGQIRHNTAFHYSNELVGRALADRAGRPESRLSKITAGDNISLWRLHLADDILESIVLRQIWKIPRAANLQHEADNITAFGGDLCVAFLNFSGEYIFRFVKEHAAY
ncbi:MAG: hypothetical protein ABSE05_13205 [Syntrophales bacterium]|jgi:hypothetical protein